MAAAARASRTETLPFTVDAALLAELGERLVGKPHIALAELIKNSYDADATHVRVVLRDEEIVVSDDGQGMTRDEFKRFWMRIGSPHKDEQQVSREFGRALTGSKGVGRLAVQFLGAEMTLDSAADAEPGRVLRASVNWDRAVRAKNLTSATVRVRSGPGRLRFPEGDEEGKRHGTTISIKRLKHAWDPDDLEELAQEIWTLQPPFRSDSASEFTVSLDSPNIMEAAAFEKQMKAVFRIWTARLKGKLVRDDDGARVNLSLTFSDGRRFRETYPLEHDVLDQLDFEIRIYSLRYRQPQGIRVEDARKYFNTFGGVHVYDAGFHLPYYGAETDWLGIEMDHSHRLSRSQLLPKRLRVKDGQTFLPTNSRIYGTVNIDTAHERRSGRERETDSQLSIQVTRDRLVDNAAFAELARVVRWAIDYYANREAARQQAEHVVTGARLPDVSAAARTVGQVIDQHRDDIPSAVRKDLTTQLQEVVSASQSEAERIAANVGLLGALATAGVTTLAYEHEMGKQLVLLDDVQQKLASGKTRREREAARQLEEWLSRARGTRALFSHLLDEPAREEVREFRALPVVESVLSQTAPFMRDVVVDKPAIESVLSLPPGRFSEWVALFQNVVVNAANAMLDTPDKRLLVRERGTSARPSLQILDTGVGVDVERSERLFEPFVRELELSPERRALRLGGSGLGLTIVRMLATNLGCDVRFRPTSAPWTTCLEFAWNA